MGVIPGQVCSTIDKVVQNFEMSKDASLKILSVGADVAGIQSRQCASCDMMRADFDEKQHQIHQLCLHLLSNSTHLMQLMLEIVVPMAMNGLTWSLFTVL
jgi:hypothetical protein